jgi:hypothetical protein|tara:strand:- start:167 stop:370 length:204 start_codon:yes stop_codon:yes gene_type:complete
MSERYTAKVRKSNPNAWFVWDSELDNVMMAGSEGECKALARRLNPEPEPVAVIAPKRKRAPRKRKAT